MKKIMVTFLAIATLMVTATAQEHKGFKKGKHGGHHGMMMKELNLTDAQKAQMKADNETFKKKMMELNKNENITVKEQRDQRAALAKEKKAKFQALLTTEQKAKMADLKKQKEQQHKEMAALKMEKMKTNLGLSDAQVSKLKAGNEAKHAKIKAIKENESLSREDRKAQIMSIKEEHKATLKQVLSTEQFNKMEEMKKNKEGIKNKKGMKKDKMDRES